MNKGDKVVTLVKMGNIPANSQGEVLAVLGNNVRVKITHDDACKAMNFIMTYQSIVKFRKETRCQ